MKVLLVKYLTKYPPIGLGYLAAVLRQRGISVDIIDYQIDRYDEARFKTRILELKPDVVGISCLSFYVKPCFEIARMVKEVRQDCHVVIGGPHATGLPEHCLSFDDVDTVIVGEGEHTLPELVFALATKKDFSAIHGLGYRINGRVQINQPRPIIEDVDSIPYPAFDLFHLDKYYERADPHGMAMRNKRYMPVLTSRGCPFRCTYCHRTLGKNFRPRSPENIIGEMELLYHKYGIREFHIEDDVFNLQMDRAKRILELMLKKGLKVSVQLPNGMRIDCMDKELAVLLKRAGTFMTAIGIESGSPEVLKSMKKGLHLDKVEKGIRLLTNQGILVWGYFMIGFPGETRTQMEETIKLACRLGLHFASFSIVTPFPGTELFEAVRNKIDLNDYFKDRLTYSTPKIQLSEVPVVQIIEVKKLALKRFYSPWRILRIASHISTFNEIHFYWEKFKKNILNPRFGKLPQANLK
ncbi:MAG: radical SAM protein [Candidatus Omnitrophota bacterium]